MSRRHQKNTEKQLIDIVNSRGNDNKCGECKAQYPTWASYNLGIFLCGRCASVHKRILGPPNYNISKVKSLTLDNWTDEQVNKLRKIGNAKARKKWNSKKIPFPYDGDDDVGVVEQYIRDKYILGKYRDDDIDQHEFDDDRMSKYSNASDDIVSRRSRSNSTRSIPGVIPKLTHRKLTTFEYTQYQNQVNKIRTFGYNDRDEILESLLLSNGNIDRALDILDQDIKINPAKEETAPSLPNRPRASTTTSTNTVQSQPTSSNSDWWSSNGQQQQQLPQQQTGIIQQQPQIYQYTDPITGQISYVDQNGQEYLDPNNPQHQQQLQAMNNPQLIAQQTSKQNIMSLYNQPTGVVSPQQQQQQQTGYFGQQQQQPQQQIFQQQQTPQFTGFQQVPQQQQQTGYFGQQYTGYGQQQQGYYR
ncbi:GTS1 [Candida jiufengensis]|uniref:GTS1 n=1 Tax=Candida jiufengensis TaxID=497108 RepID=UPI0022252745|nr:GTS1 [Candida jiufengensis]KAI5954418.1 GTS1 [Candida jiufengensis]